MATQQEIMNKKGGAFYKVIVKGQTGFLKKGLESNLIKETTMCIRLGIRRSNMKIVQEIALRNPTPQSTTPRATWYHYVNDRIVEHNTNQELFVKAYLKAGSKPKVRYLLNGVEVDKQWLIDNKYISKGDTFYNEVGDLIININNLTFA